MISNNFLKARNRIQNPKKRGQEKALEALDWIRRWGHSSPLIIDQLSGVKRRGLSKRLVDGGLVKVTMSGSGGYFNDVPHKILTLTSKGFQILDHFKKLNYGYDFTKSVNQLELRHHHICQKITLEYLLNSQNLMNFSTEIDRADKSILMSKQPDVVLVFDQTLPHFIEQDIQRLSVVAVEVVLTGKYDRKFDQFLHSSLISLGENGSYDEMEIYFDSAHQLARYKNAFMPGREVNVWEKNDRGYWEVEEKVVIPQNIKHKIQFKLLP